MAKSISFSFGRFNPPTIGHEKLMDNTRRANKNYRIYASQSQDAKKNPLDFKTKVTFMKAMFPVHARSISTDKVKTAIDVMVNLYKEKYTDVIMVVGSDRVVEFDKLLNAYNGKKARHGYYKFNSIKVKSAGERDPDAEGVSGMSASKMRKAAQDNDYASFEKGLPKKFRQGKMLFRTLQKTMSIKSLKEFIEEGMLGSGYAIAIKHPKGWKIVFSGNKRDQNAEIKKLQKSGKKLGKDFRGYRTKQPVGNIVESLEKDKKNQDKDPVGRQHDEACWDTHKQVGTKKKGNKIVPNCVPKNESLENEIDENFFKLLLPKQFTAAQKRIYKKEYTAAAKMYQQFIKRGDKTGVALHKAASSFKHVSDRGLQQFLKR